MRNSAITMIAVTVALGLNASVIGAFAYDKYDDYRKARPDYMAQHGRWETFELPDEYRVRAIHAALLYTGEVLLIAGSGNSQEHFDAGTFETVLWNPVTGATTKVDTPEDLFCGGHAYLPNGDLLVAGGTSKYEVLQDKVDSAAGSVTVKNERDAGFMVRGGDAFTAPDGREYRSTQDVLVQGAEALPTGERVAGEAKVWVEAVEPGEGSVIDGDNTQFRIARVAAEDRSNIYGVASFVTLDKQNYRGLDASYIFSVAERRYVPTARLTSSRWYPTLVSVNGGNVLAVSGLDEHGNLLPGNNEVFELSNRTWYDQPELFRYFPTYPQLFRLADGRLFYSGSNTGYGSATEGRQPGIWDLTDNSWQDVPGLRDPQMNETSSSFLLPPAQEQKVGIIGGGEIGEGAGSTGRFDVVDLDASDEPRYEAALTYPSPGRYISTVTLPDDTVLFTGGSKDYRGKGLSDLHLTRIYGPASNELLEAAPNEVGRNYHSTAVLLPDGRVMTMGSDPLFADAHDHVPGTFETRIEVYSPPYLFTGTERPQVLAAPAQVQRGTTFEVTVDSDSRIDKARLIRPSAVTHLTDPEQRSVALDITPAGDGVLALSLDEREGLTPSGYYILVVVDENGVPSVGEWVRVR
jgi:hypothetical protein